MPRQPFSVISSRRASSGPAGLDEAWPRVRRHKVHHPAHLATSTSYTKTWVGSYGTPQKGSIHLAFTGAVDLFYYTPVALCTLRGDGSADFRIFDGCRSIGF